MSIVIRVTEQVYGRLQKLATPFVDTPAIVIERLLEFYEKTIDKNSQPPMLVIRTSKPSPGVPPDLTHTIIINGQVNDQPARNWNTFLKEAVRAATYKGSTREELVSFMQNIDLGQRNDCGFRYFPDLDLSLQGVSANTAWDLSCRLANRYRFPLYVKFEWRNNKGAAYPGKLGELKFIESKGVTFNYID